MSHIPVNFALPPQTRTVKCSPVDSVHGWSDFFGVAASIGCAIHCAALPVFVAVLPAWGLDWMVHESAHKWMFVICLLIAIIAFVPSLIRHRNLSPLALGSVGLVCIGLGAFAPSSCSCGGCSRCVAAAETSESVPGSIAEMNSTKIKTVLSRIESAPKSASAIFAVADTGSSGSNLAASQPTEGPRHGWTLMTLWITPIGGVLLVVAHLLNHHFGSFCRC